jgi:hypothetical protein
VRKTTAAALLLFVLLLAAGCGSSSKTSAPTTSTQSTSTEPTTEASMTTTKGTGKMDSSCLAMVKLGSQFSKALSAAAGTNGDIGKQAETSVKLLKVEVAAAPSEIKPDIEAFEKAFESYAAALKGVHLKPGTRPSATVMAKILTASKALSSASLRAHSVHISTWSAKHCGTPTPTATG